MTMKNEYTAVVKQEGEWWLGWIEEIPGVNCQEKSHKELMETLEITLTEALEFNRQDALTAAGSGYSEGQNGDGSCFCVFLTFLISHQAIAS